MIDRYENVKATVEGDEVVIRCKIDKSQADTEPSKPGKTYVLITSNDALKVVTYLTILDEEVLK